MSYYVCVCLPLLCSNYSKSQLNRFKMCIIIVLCVGGGLGTSSNNTFLSFYFFSSSSCLPRLLWLLVLVLLLLFLTALPRQKQLSASLIIVIITNAIIHFVRARLRFTFFIVFVCVCCVRTCVFAFFTFHRFHTRARVARVHVCVSVFVLQCYICIKDKTVWHTKSQRSSSPYLIQTHLMLLLPHMQSDHVCFICSDAWLQFDAYSRSYSCSCTMSICSGASPHPGRRCERETAVRARRKRRTARVRDNII